jgi:hypothetical protein
MKQLLAGFIDVWKVVIIDPLRSNSVDPIINLFDLGVFTGIASMIFLIVGTVIGISKIFS